MQRLFSTFPNDWPGCGLLLLRITVAAPLLIGSLSFIGGAAHHPTPPMILIVELATGGLLIIGLCTPLSALLLVLLEIGIVLVDRDVFTDHAMLAALSASILMLGPGAWSMDARLFGRRRIELPDD